jgi:hypothetical protein
MTLSPSDTREVFGLEGPSYELPDACAHCGGVDGLQRHHAWRKSDVIGDKWWVFVPEDVVVGNCLPLCHACHRQITDNYAQLEFNGYRMDWSDMLNASRQLAWQPPMFQIDEQGAEYIRGFHQFYLFDPDLHQHITPQLEFVHSNAGEVHDPRFCPTCKRKLPKPKDEELEEKKVRKTWSVAVPVSQQEDGADVLDALIESSRLELFDAGLPYGESDSAKYHVMATSLSLFVLHAKRILGDS